MAGERGSATIIALFSAFLLIGVSALVALEIAEIGARRAETRKIEALGLAVMERAGEVALWPASWLRVDSIFPAYLAGRS